MPAIAEAPSDLDQLDALIAADEAKDGLSNGSATQAADDGAGAGAGDVVKTAGSGKETGSGTQAATGTAAKTETGKGEGEQRGKGEKEQGSAAEPSKYEKARARQAEAWKTISETKAELAMERAAVKAEREQMLRTAQASRPAGQQVALEQTRTPEQYEAFADRAEKEGKFDLAELARDEAKRLRANPPAAQQAGQQASRPAGQQASAPSDEAAQLASWAQAKKEFPEITDPKSPVNQQLVSWLQENPAILDFPNGPYLATVFVRNSQRAARVPELETKLEAATNKIKELEALTAPAQGGSPAQLGEEKPWQDKSLKEMEYELEALVRGNG